jgi:hypothetical protein
LEKEMKDDLFKNNIYVFVLDVGYNIIEYQFIRTPLPLNA